MVLLETLKVEGGTGDFVHSIAVIERKERAVICS